MKKTLRELFEAWWERQKVGRAFQNVDARKEIERACRRELTLAERGELTTMLGRKVSGGFAQHEKRKQGYVKLADLITAVLPVVSPIEVQLAHTLDRLRKPTIITHCELKGEIPSLNGKSIDKVMEENGYLRYHHPTAKDSRWPLRSGNGTAVYFRRSVLDTQILEHVRGLSG